MDWGSTERLPRETPAPEDYYELTNSRPPATCVGCQAWSKAQGSGSCPVGVRRFKSCPTHSFRSVDHRERPQNDSAAVSLIRPSSPLGNWGLDGIWTTRLRKGKRRSPDLKLAGNPCTKIDIPPEPIQLEARANRKHPTHLCVQPSYDSDKGDDSEYDIRPPRCLRYGYTFERSVL